MGWSCTKAASDVARKWSEACVASTGSSNTYKVGNERYFFEISNKEHADGAITGTIMRIVPAPASHRAMIAPTAAEMACGVEAETFFARKAGSFRINGDGSIARAPAFLKAASA